MKETGVGGGQLVLPACPAIQQDHGTCIYRLTLIFAVEILEKSGLDGRQ